MTLNGIGNMTPKQKAGTLSFKLQRDSRAEPTTLTCGVSIAADLNKLSNVSWKTSCRRISFRRVMFV